LRGNTFRFRNYWGYETSWFDWSLPAKHADVYRFVRLCSWDEAEAVREAVYAVQPRSLVVLVGRMMNEINM